LRAVIFANGDLNDPQGALHHLHPEDLLIAADGGLHHCRTLGLTPQVLIGDFDSISAHDLVSLEAKGTRLLRHPPAKDYTDLELALQYACDAGASEVLLFAALGGRWDQTIANLLLPASPGLEHISITIVDGTHEIRLLDARLQPVEHEISAQPGDTLSLIPISNEASGVVTHGLKYPLKNESLLFGATRGVSNQVQETPARVRLGKGLLACILIRQ
jgi:thiamine pyrophosphokinase